MKPELQPCPFCDMGLTASDGWPAALSVPAVALQPWSDKPAVRCDWCGAWGPYADTEKDAVRRWNERSKK